MTFYLSLVKSFGDFKAQFGSYSLNRADGQVDLQRYRLCIHQTMLHVTIFIEAASTLSTIISYSVAESEQNCPSTAAKAIVALGLIEVLKPRPSTSQQE